MSYRRLIQNIQSNEQRRPVPAALALGFDVNNFNVRAYMLPRSYERLQTYRRTRVRDRNLQIQINPRDTLFLQLTPLANRGAQAGVPLAAVDERLQATLRTIGLPENVPLFLSINLLGRDGSILGGNSMERQRFDTINDASIQGMFDLIQDHGYVNHEWYHCVFTVEMYVRPLVSSFYRGGQDRMQCYRQYKFPKPNQRYLFEYAHWTPGQKAAHGRQLKRAMLPHLQHLRGIYIYPYDAAFQKPVCGIMSLLYGIELMKVRRGGEGSDEARRKLKQWEDMTLTWYQEAVRIYDHYCFQNSCSLDELASIQKVLYPNAHLMVFDSFQNILFTRWSTSTVSRPPPDEGYKTGELTLDYVNSLRDDSISLFLDYEYRHILPIYDIKYFSLLFTSVEQIIHNPGLLDTSNVHDQRVLPQSFKKIPSKHNMAKLMKLHVDDGVGIAEVEVSSSNHTTPCPSCLTMLRYDRKHLEKHFCQKLQCALCHGTFTAAQQLANHRRGTPLRCLQCGSICFGAKCLRMHETLCTGITYLKCDYCYTSLPSNQMPFHKCRQFKCNNCQQYVRNEFLPPDEYHAHGTVQTHKCPFKRRSLPKDRFNKQPCFVFDFESMLYSDNSLTYPFFDDEADQEGVYVSTPVFVHIVNCVSWRSLKQSSEDECHKGTVGSLDAFWENVLQLSTAPTTFWIAHNLKGYDGRLLYDHLEQKDIVPEEMIWIGGKIMTMRYRHPNQKSVIVFRDSLCHLAAPLAKLPAMFGLDTSIVRKGFFPYLFNLPENQNYIGRIPDPGFFGVNEFNDSKREEFNEWYNERARYDYNFREEMILYCENDVEVLGQALEAYVKICADYGSMNPIPYLTIAQFTFQNYMTFYLPENTLCLLDERHSTFARRALRGGNTNVRRMYYRCEELEAHPSKGENGLRYVDIQSLYPTVQYFDMLPIGYPTTKIYSLDNQPTRDILDTFCGFIECDVRVVRYHPHPILPIFNDNRMFMTLHPVRRIVITSVELRELLTCGYYELGRIYRIDFYEGSFDLFKSFIRNWLKLKIISSSKPSDVNAYLRELKRRYNMDVTEEEFQPNPALRTLAKLVLNSLWGKFGQQPVKRQTKMLHTSKDKLAYYNLKINKRIIEKDVVPAGLNCTMVHYENQESRDMKNVALASFVTANARMRLWRILNKLGDRVLYHDTDSVIYERDPYDYNVAEGEYLGDWESETGKFLIHEFVALAPKTYAYTYCKYTTNERGEEIKEYVTAVKSKGYTMNNTNAINFTLKMYKRLLLAYLIKYSNNLSSIDRYLRESTEPLESTNVTCVRFQHLPKAHKTVTFEQIKELMCDYSKGHVDPLTTMTYPFGALAFPEDVPIDRLIGFDPFESCSPIDCFEGVRDSE